MVPNDTISMIPRQDNIELHNQFKKYSRLHIPDFLTQPSAELIHKHLSKQTEWNLVWNNGGTHTDMDFTAVENWSKEQKQQLQNVIYKQAEDQFQYFYATVPIYDIYQSNGLPGHFFNHIYEFINSEDFLNSMRTITGMEAIEFADIQATRYSGGHFLTEHDDNVAGKGRLAAFVLNLTPIWNDAWGGALVFHNRKENDSAFSELLFPTFNTLNIFSVPQPHSVSLVSQFASANRYSLTGWLRSHTT